MKHQMSESSISNGAAFENKVAEYLDSIGLQYCRNAVVGRSPIGGSNRVDFLLGDGRVLECKYHGKQPGTLYQKYWYTLAALNMNSSIAILVLGCHPTQAVFIRKVVAAMRKSCLNHVTIIDQEEFYSGSWS